MFTKRFHENIVDVYITMVVKSRLPQFNNTVWDRNIASVNSKPMGIVNEVNMCILRTSSNSPYWVVNRDTKRIGRWNVRMRGMQRCHLCMLLILKFHLPIRFESLFSEMEKDCCRSSLITQNSTLRYRETWNKREVQHLHSNELLCNLNGHSQFQESNHWFIVNLPSCVFIFFLHNIDMHVF